MFVVFKDWNQHVNTSQHADSQLKLLQRLVMLIMLTQFITKVWITKMVEI